MVDTKTMSYHRLHTPHCIMWTIWRERNHRTFEDEEKSIDSIQDMKNIFFLRSLLEYCTMIGGITCSSAVDFLDLLNVRW